MSRPEGLAAQFTAIYETNKWKGGTPSGPGASLPATAFLRRALPFVLRAVDAHVLLDAPCGDFNWFQDQLGALDRYIGVDIVPALIDANQRYASDRVSFQVGDITRDQLPQADLALCRDCLVHLVEDDAMQAIEHFREAGIAYLLATTFYAQEKNSPGSTGGWRPINLQRPPFDFPPPLMLLPERVYDPAQPHSDKSLGLWELSSLSKTKPAEAGASAASPPPSRAPARQASAKRASPRG